MRFAIIEPALERVREFNADNLDDAAREAGLSPMEVDHGTIVEGLGIVVYEYSLMDNMQSAAWNGNVANQWFAFGGQLFGGNAVCYGYDDRGETIDVPFGDGIQWRAKFYHSLAEARDGGARGEFAPPRIAVNEDVIWRWPDPA